MISFVIAIESEAKPVFANLTDARFSEANGKKTAFGKLCGADVSVVVCGVGKVNAAAGTQYAIDCLGADKIVNLGVAGGLNAAMSVGEIFEISAAVQYDVDLVQINGTEIGRLNEFEETYLPLAGTGKFPAKKLATGDRFNDSARDFRLLTETLGAEIRDMEGGAIAQVCAHARVPFYAFKAISDVAGSGSTTEQFLANLARCAGTLEKAVPAIFAAVDAA